MKLANERVAQKRPTALNTECNDQAFLFQELASRKIVVDLRADISPAFLLLSQPTLFDPTRAPVGRHIVWAYCHIPNGSSFDMTEHIERQIARFAPGFYDRVLVRRATSAAELESKNANLIGAAITGGTNDLWQMVARPILSAVPYRTPIKGMFLCSSSTPPGGGVHGMCGFHGANAALNYLRTSSPPSDRNNCFRPVLPIDSSGS